MVRYVSLRLLSFSALPKLVSVVPTAAVARPTLLVAS